MATADWLLSMGYRAVVADYMIPTEENPHVCRAGQALMCGHAGFKPVGVEYDNTNEPEYVAGEVPLQRFAVVCCDVSAATLGPIGRRLGRLVSFIEYQRLKKMARRLAGAAV